MGIRKQEISLNVSKGTWDQEVDALAKAIRNKKATITLDVQGGGAAAASTGTKGAVSTFLDPKQVGLDVEEVGKHITKLEKSIKDFNTQHKITIVVDSSQLTAVETQLKSIQTLMSSISGQKVNINVSGSGAGGGGGSGTPKQPATTKPKDPFTRIAEQQRLVGQSETLLASQSGLNIERAARRLAESSVKTGIPVTQSVSPTIPGRDAIAAAIRSRAEELIASGLVKAPIPRVPKPIAATKPAVTKAQRDVTSGQVLTDLNKQSGFDIERAALSYARNVVRSGGSIPASTIPPQTQKEQLAEAIKIKAQEYITSGIVKPVTPKAPSPASAKTTTPKAIKPISANQALAEIEKAAGFDLDRAALKLAKTSVDKGLPITLSGSTALTQKEQIIETIKTRAQALVASGQVQKTSSGSIKTTKTITPLQAAASVVSSGAGFNDPELETLASNLAQRSIRQGKPLTLNPNATTPEEIQQNELITRALEINASKGKRGVKTSGQFRQERAVAEFRETATVKEVLTGFFKGDEARKDVRLEAAKAFGNRKGIQDFDQLVAADIKARGLDPLVNVKNLGKGPVLQQLGFAGIFGGLPGIAAAAAGAVTPLGVQGALIGSSIQQAVGGLIEPIIEAFKSRRHEFEEAGLTFQRSILGISAGLQSTSQVVGRSGGPIGNAQAALAFQEQRATDIQLAARSRLARLGIGGQTEATFVQGISSALSARGISFTPAQLANISGKLGAAIVTQRPQLLDNPTLLLRDISDLFSGGPAARRVLLSQLGGVRQALPQLQNARTAEDFERALGQAGQFESALRASTNFASLKQRIEGTTDLLQTTGGLAFLDQIRKPTTEFAKTLGIEGVEGTDTEKTFKVLGTAIGKVAGIGIDWTTNLLKLANVMTPVVDNTVKLADAFVKLLPILLAVGGTLAATRAVRIAGAVGAAVAAGGAGAAGGVSSALTGLGALLGNPSVTQAAANIGAAGTAASTGAGAATAARLLPLLRIAAPLAVGAGALLAFQAAGNEVDQGQQQREERITQGILQSAVGGVKGRTSSIISGAFDRLGLETSLLDAEREGERTPGFQLSTLANLRRQFGSAEEFQKIAAPFAAIEAKLTEQDLQERSGVFGTSIGQQLAASRFETTIANPQRFEAAATASEAAFNKYTRTVNEANKAESDRLKIGKFQDVDVERASLVTDQLFKRDEISSLEAKRSLLLAKQPTEDEIKELARAGQLTGLAATGNALTSIAAFAQQFTPTGLVLAQLPEDQRSKFSKLPVIGPAASFIQDLLGGKKALFPEKLEDFSALAKREKQIDEFSQKIGEANKKDLDITNQIAQIDTSKTVGNIKEILAGAEGFVQKERELLKIRESSVRALEVQAEKSDTRFRGIESNFFTGSATDVFNRGLIQTANARDQLGRNLEVIQTRQANIAALRSQQAENKTFADAARRSGNIEVTRTFERLGQDIQLQTDANRFDLEQNVFQRVGIRNRQFQGEDASLQAFDAQGKALSSAFNTRSLAGQEAVVRNRISTIDQKLASLSNIDSDLDFEIANNLVPEGDPERVKLFDRRGQNRVTRNLALTEKFQSEQDLSTFPNRRRTLEIEQSLLGASISRGDLLAEESEKRRVLNREIESSTEALRNFDSTVREAKVSQSLSITQAALRVQSLGGSAPSFLDTSPEGLKQLELAQAKGSLNKLLRDSGLPGGEGDVGSSGILGLSGEFGKNLEFGRGSIAEALRTRNISRENLTLEGESARLQQGLKFFGLSRSLDPASVPGASQQGIPEGFQQAFFESQLQKFEPVANLTNVATEQSSIENDVKGLNVIGASLLQNSIALITKVDDLPKNINTFIKDGAAVTVRVDGPVTVNTT